MDICDMKIIHEGLDISDIKMLIGMLETTEIFVGKQIEDVVSIIDVK